MKFLKNKVNDQNLGIFLAISSSLFISIEILFVDYLFRNNPSINSFEMFFWSCVGLIIFGAPFFLFSKKSIQNIKSTYSEHRNLLVKDSLISVFAALFYFIGISYIGSGSTSIFLRSSLFFSVLLGIILLKEKLSIKEILVIILMSIGFLLYQENYDFNSLLGVLIILFSTFLYSLISYLIKKENNNHHSFYYSYIRQIFMTSFSLILFFLFLKHYYNLNFIGIENFLILSIGSLCGGILSRATAMIALSKIELHKFSIVKNSDIIFVLLGSYVLFSDIYSPIRLLGVAVVIISIIIYSYHKKENNHHIFHS